MNSYQTEYMNVWIQGFQGLLGWSESQTMLWAAPLLQNMEPPGMIINETPIYYIARELVDRRQDVQSLLPRDREYLIRAAETILRDKGGGGEFRKAFNFAEANKRLENLFKRIHSGGIGHF
jgi:hypothetical protein